MMRRCKACGAEFRKGKLAIVHSRKDGLQGGHVCPDCASKGSLIVAKVSDVVKVVEKKQQDDTVARILWMLRIYARAARFHQPRTDFLNGQAEGLETAIEVIKRVK
jgi:DNA-directed RNA polymerase subunit RPC12/RpoP